MTHAYLRYPHVHQDLLTFVAADDVWLTTVDGGRAWRLSHDRAPVSYPRISPDGAHVAFVSTRDGHPEVMVLDLSGGAARRLTWWGASITRVLGWTGAGQVLVASNAGQTHSRHAVVFAVDLDGTVHRRPYGPAGGIAIHHDGAVVLSTPLGRSPAHWKRYRGGTAARLWLDARGDGQWQRLLPGEHAPLHDPMWVGNTLVFTSDRAASFPDRADEQANLWAWDTPGTGEPRQVTHQGTEQGYVRDASTDGKQVVWSSRGEVWLLDELTATPRTVAVTLPGAAPVPFDATPTKNLDAVVPDHGGDASVVSWRGNVFHLAHREGPARAVAADSGVRRREPVLLGRTGWAVMASDVAGEDCLEVRAVAGDAAPRQLAGGQLGRVLHLASDPAGEQVAVSSHDGAVRLVRIADGAVRDLGLSPQGEAMSPVFSADGRYLVWTQPTMGEAELHRLMIVDLHDPEGRAQQLTSGRFHDHHPAFTADGKYVVFLSDRTFDPAYDNHEFALSFTGSTRPWLIPLAARQPAPFGPSADGWRISTPDPVPGTDGDAPAAAGRAAGHGPQGAGGQAGADQGPPASPDLDLEGAEERIVPFPVPSGTYTDLQAVAQGVVWISEAGEAGVLGSRRAGVRGEPAPNTLQLWNFDQRTLTTIVDKVDSYAVSGDGKRLVVRHQDTLTVVPADRKVDKDDDPDKVTVELDRLRFRVDPRAEWLQMFDENARLMRDHFWRADMDGVDWDAVVARYRPLVHRVCSHDDLVDLLWETVGELNTSHAYVIPTDPAHRAERKLGHLGADLSRTEQGWRIDRILPGESSEPDARSPLRAAGVDARAGDIIVAVDGQGIDLAAGPGAGLIGAADKPVELTLRRGGTDRRVVVVPLADEEVLRYQDWVRSRREYVRERSGGRLGYLHVPDMMSYGWAQLHRDLRQATSAEAMIADVRYNRGGHTSQLVVARLAATVVSWSVGRHYAEAMTYPANAPRGPVVLVANEHSGSDGDIVNAAARAMGIGPVVGMRTWGGVVGIDGRFELVDGTSVTQPRYATWMEGQDWGLENHGVDPDIEVEHSPADFFSTDDPQLDRAMAQALELLERHGSHQPPALPEPKVSPGRE